MLAAWMRSNRLQLNSDKTEFVWCIPPRRHHQLPADQLTIDGTPLSSVNTVRNLCVHVDNDLSMATHSTQLVNSCFAALRQICSIRRSLPRSTLSTLATSFIMTRVDYCNVVLAGLPQCELQQLQTVVNAAARLTAGAQKYDHVTPLLKDLHWLRVPERNTYKLCALTFRCLNGLALQYLSELLQPVSDLESRQRLRSSSTQHQLNWLCRACDDPRSATAPLLSPRLAHETVCLTHCTDCHHWNSSNLICAAGQFVTVKRS